MMHRSSVVFHKLLKMKMINACLAHQLSGILIIKKKKTGHIISSVNFKTQRECILKSESKSYAFLHVHSEVQA